MLRDFISADMPPVERYRRLVGLRLVGEVCYQRQVSPQGFSRHPGDLQFAPTACVSRTLGDQAQGVGGSGRRGRERQAQRLVGRQERFTSGIADKQAALRAYSDVQPFAKHGRRAVVVEGAFGSQAEPGVVLLARAILKVDRHLRLEGSGGFANLTGQAVQGAVFVAKVALYLAVPNVPVLQAVAPVLRANPRQVGPALPPAGKRFGGHRGRSLRSMGSQ